MLFLSTPPPVTKFVNMEGSGTIKRIVLESTVTLVLKSQMKWYVIKIVSAKEIASPCICIAAVILACL